MTMNLMVADQSDFPYAWVITEQSPSRRASIRVGLGDPEHAVSVNKAAVELLIESLTRVLATMEDDPALAAPDLPHVY